MEKQQQRQRPTSNLMAWRAGFTFIIPTDPSHEKSASAGLHFSCNWALELSGSFSEKEKRRTLSPALAVSTLATSQALCRVTKRSRTPFFCWFFFVAGRYGRTGLTGSETNSLSSELFSPSKHEHIVAVWPRTNRIGSTNMLHSAPLRTHYVHERPSVFSCCRGQYHHFQW